MTKAINQASLSVFEDCLKSDFASKQFCFCDGPWENQNHLGCLLKMKILECPFLLPPVHLNGWDGTGIYILAKA